MPLKRKREAMDSISIKANQYVFSGLLVNKDFRFFLLIISLVDSIILYQLATLYQMID